MVYMKARLAIGNPPKTFFEVILSIKCLDNVKKVGLYFKKVGFILKCLLGTRDNFP